MPGGFVVRNPFCIMVQARALNVLHQILDTTLPTRRSARIGFIACASSPLQQVHAELRMRIQQGGQQLQYVRPCFCCKVTVVDQTNEQIMAPTTTVSRPDITLAHLYVCAAIDWLRCWQSTGIVQPPRRGYSVACTHRSSRPATEGCARCLSTALADLKSIDSYCTAMHG